uniref:Uncharacterized protein n=1 Tax=Brugia malayi TaxID=6279 RepID=A8PSB9_BRUMA
MEFGKVTWLQRARFRGGATGIRNSGGSVVRKVPDCTIASLLPSTAFCATTSCEEERDVDAHIADDLLSPLSPTNCCFTEETSVRGVEVVEGKNDADISKLCRFAAFPTRPKSADIRFLRPKRASASNKKHKIQRSM